MKTPTSCHSAVAGLALVAMFVAGCSTSRKVRNVIPPSFINTPGIDATAAVDPSLLQRPTFEYRLGPGDVLDIEVLGDVNTQSTTVVGPDGKIYFYLLPGIDVWGLTIPAAREKLVAGFQTLIREQQPVSVTLRKPSNQRVWILGRLGRPGIYSMSGPMTLLEALAEAGGPAAAPTFASMAGATSTPGAMSTAAGINAAGGMSAPGAVGMSGGLGMTSPRGGAEESADLSRAFVIRNGERLRIDFKRLVREGDMSQNVYLHPNDFVYLPSAKVGNVHVLGAVESPRAVSYTNNLSLVQALAQAGGPLRRNAHISQVAIVRGSLTEPQVAVVDIRPMLAGRAPDIALQPQDIVFVPHTPYRVLTRYVDLILDTFVRTVGVNEGARAVDGRAQPLGVTVPLGSL